MSRRKEKANNTLPDDIIQMSFQDWTDPVFLRENLTENEEPNNYVFLNGKRVPANTTLTELELALSNNNAYSDPGEYNVVSLPKHRNTTKKQTKSKMKAKPNNRFGFKKAFGSLTRGLKKLTGRTRRN
jgi:hypothetical protein